ncbi:hypothetical protein VTL71DRAFT_7981 [Oculimacula yallundae]|uniref:DUF6594 domain-containing protein n=1 Tax=Oculimacula yallundae TaxID=86028 RepID=A0ABR4CWM3_9HELO
MTGLSNRVIYPAAIPPEADLPLFRNASLGSIAPPPHAHLNPSPRSFDLDRETRSKGQSVRQSFTKPRLPSALLQLYLYSSTTWCKMGGICSIFVDKRRHIKDGRYSRFIKQNLEMYPEGYPRLAAIVNGTSEAALFRRFGILHARLLLYQQVEITELEAQLDALDISDAENQGSQSTLWRLSNSISLNDGFENTERKKLVENIASKLKAYDEAILREANMRKLPRAGKRVHRNFFDVAFTEHALSEKDERFLYHEHDFVLLEEQEQSWLDPVFISSDDKAKTLDPYLNYYSEERFGILVNVIIAVTSAAILLIPVYLFLVCEMSVKLMASVILIFALTFSSAISILTKAKRQEVFAATAAYVAVLVVFVGNLQQQTISHR